MNVASHCLHLEETKLTGVNHLSRKSTSSSRRSKARSREIRINQQGKVEWAQLHANEAVKVMGVHWKLSLDVVQQFRSHQSNGQNGHTG